jgi:uncharacterized protein (DUF302 family)
VREESAWRFFGFKPSTEGLGGVTMATGQRESRTDAVPYGFVQRLAGVSFDDALERVTQALAGEGFGVLCRIDVRETLAKKLGVELRPYVILGACNPDLAKQAIEAEPHVGLLLPCNVVVQASPEGGEGGVVVSIADPGAMFTLVSNPAAAHVAAEADARLRRVMEQLAR